MNQQDRSRQRTLRTVLVVVGGGMGLVVLGVLSASGVVVASEALVPAGAFIVVMTGLQVVLMRIR